MNSQISISFEHRIVFEKGTILIWKLSDFQQEIGIQGSKKELERQTVLKMLHKLGHYTDSLHYKSNGQPQITIDSTLFLSISHSEGWFAIFVANVPVGIDIQEQRKSIIRGKAYFVNKRDLLLEQSLQNLHLIWGAKEAFYKKQEGQISDLREEVSVGKIDLGNKTLELEFQKSVEELSFLQFESAYLVWTRLL
jgi:phosphopantetheinyl transferase